MVRSVYFFLKGVTEMDILSIGQVARRAEVGVETVRFYEREGLLEEPPRRASGYRPYSEELVNRLRFIKRAQQLGFSLKEISELLLLRGRKLPRWNGKWSSYIACGRPCSRSTRSAQDLGQPVAVQCWMHSTRKRC